MLADSPYRVGDTLYTWISKYPGGEVDVAEKLRGVVREVRWGNPQGDCPEWYRLTVDWNYLLDTKNGDMWFRHEELRRE